MRLRRFRESRRQGSILERFSGPIRLHVALGSLLGCLRPVLGALGTGLGRSWGLLGRSWAALGRSWAALGRSWAALGRSWDALGRSWGALEAPKSLLKRYFLQKVNFTKIVKNLRKNIDFC